MRKLRVFESISIDGYFADAADDMTWAHAGRTDPAFAAWVGGNASGDGVLLFGRKTYQMMEAFWPTPAAAQQMPAVAAGMNRAVKLVASRTIRPTWQHARLVEGDLVDAIRALKATPGPNVVVLGSGSIAAQLGDAGLVDEYQFVVVPIALGAGRTVFTGRRALRRIEQRAFANGNLAVTYEVA
ncbi:MAG TPA: dihydrofolate reductase family protein [Kofleriaceae bacterium]